MSRACQTQQACDCGLCGPLDTAFPSYVGDQEADTRADATCNRTVEEVVIVLRPEAGGKEIDTGCDQSGSVHGDADAVQASVAPHHYGVTVQYKKIAYGRRRNTSQRDQTKIGTTPLQTGQQLNPIIGTKEVHQEGEARDVPSPDKMQEQRLDTCGSDPQDIAPSKKERGPNTGTGAEQPKGAYW